nr:hypothetical protein [Trebonia kvetii]
MTQAPIRRLPKRSRAETRALMLRAATELVCEGMADSSDAAVSAALAHVQLTEVAARANVIVRAELPPGEFDGRVAAITTGAIYQVWPTQGEFQADLLFHLAELDAAFRPTLDEVAGIVTAAVDDGRPLPQTLAAMIEVSFRHTRDSAIFYASLGFYLRSGNERVRAVLRHGDDDFLAAIGPVWKALLDGYGLRMRAPFVLDDLSISIGALLEGFALQWKRQPERTVDPLGEKGWSLPGRLAAMILCQMTEPARSLEDRSLPGELFDDQVDSEQDQGDAGESFGALTPAFGDLRPECQAELRGDECLQGDGDDHRDHRQTGQADAEPDGQLVEADADPKPDKGQPAAGGDAGRLVFLPLFVGEQHPATDADHGSGGDIVGDLADAVGQRGAKAKADQRHAALEGHEDQRDPQPLPGRGNRCGADSGGDGE